MFFRIQVFEAPGFSGSWFFCVQIFPDPGFSGSGSRVRAQVLEVAVPISERSYHKFRTPCSCVTIKSIESIRAHLLYLFTQVLITACMEN